MRILKVTQRTDDRGFPWWLLTCDDGFKYATRAEHQATFARRAMDERIAVTIDYNNGWYYRNVFSIAQAPASAPAIPPGNERETMTPGHGETDPGTSPKG